MTGYPMKRKIAAALAAMMLCGSMPFGALAEDAPLVELIVPISLKTETTSEAPEAEQQPDKAELKQAELKLSLEEAPAKLTLQSAQSADQETAPIQTQEIVQPKLEKIELKKLEKADLKKLEKLEIKKIEKLEPEKQAEQITPPADQQTEPPKTQEPEPPKMQEPEQLKTQEPEQSKIEKIEIEKINPEKLKKEELQKLENLELKKPENLEQLKKPEKLDKLDKLDKLEGQVIPPKTEQTEPTKAEYAEFDMTASVKNGIITVKVSGASDGKMIAIEVSGNGVKEFNGILTEDGEGSGKLGKLDEETEEFVALDPGTYTVRAYYESKESIEKKATVTVLGTSTVTPPSGGSGSTGGSSGTEGSGSTSGSGSTEGSGGADAITPVTPPSSGDTEGVKAFTILPVVTDGSIAVVIDGASSREIEVKLLDKDGKTVGVSAIIGGGLVQLGKFASGTYTVQAQYVTPVAGEDGSYDYKRVSAQAIVPEGVDAPDKIEAVDIQAKIEKGKDYIIITVTQAADIEMMVSVEGLSDKAITKGGSVRYDGLTPGESYAVEIDYINYVEGAKKYAETVTIDKPVVLGEIKITAVTPGVNMLTVSGTATAGQQVILSTTPAAVSDVYAMPGENGVFSAEIACAAGTYSAVTAKYSADTAKASTVSGSWVVAAPAVKPSLTIDPIDSDSTTVIGKTTAGIMVEIKASDYTQKVTADNSGIVRFSLPHTYAAGTELTFVVYYGSSQSFTQTAKVAQAGYKHTLEYGDEGDAVRLLTARLEKLGYPVKESSRYGSTVREAVRLFQIANGLKANGIAGPDTQKAIFSVGAIPYGSGRYPTLVRGDKGLSLIYTLQQRLKDLGYYTIKVDGIFGSGTQRAVREFQRVNGLTVTGKADNATQMLLYSSAAKSASYAVSGDYKTLPRTSKYKSAVVPLQKRLRELGYYSGNIDGYFGSQTYRAVRNFQNRNGLTVTGVADPYTQQVLYSASAKTYSGSTASSGVTSSGYRLLYWGCRGTAVTRLQNALIDAGYKSIVRKADGIFGQWTYDAVRAYQKDHGLAVDGIAGKNTQNKLYGTKY